MANRPKIKYKPKRKNESYYIYILTCTDGKFYVGSTNNPSRRFMQHTSHLGAEWTKIHPPTGVLQVTEMPYVKTRSQLELFETKMTLEVMDAVGWTNVRGGIFNRVSDKKTREMLDSPANHKKYGY